MKARTIELSAVLESLRSGAQFTDEVIAEMLGESPPPHLGYNIALAVSEALTNAIRHCQSSGKVILGFSWDCENVVITVDDQGEELHLEDVPEPDFEDAAEGGYGLYIIRTLMDDVTLENFPGGKRLTMIKRLIEGNKPS